MSFYRPSRIDLNQSSYDSGKARLKLTKIKQTEICSTDVVPDAPSMTDNGTGRSMGKVRGANESPSRAIVLPAQQAVHTPAGRIRSPDSANAAAAHHVTDGDRRHVLLHVAHAPSVGRIHRQIARSNKCLARPWRRHRPLDEIEIG